MTTDQEPTARTFHRYRTSELSYSPIHTVWTFFTLRLSSPLQGAFLLWFYGRFLPFSTTSEPESNSPGRLHRSIQGRARLLDALYTTLWICPNLAVKLETRPLVTLEFHVIIEENLDNFGILGLLFTIGFRDQIEIAPQTQYRTDSPSEAHSGKTRTQILQRKGHQII